jgi:peptide-methionine (S)-S-oxide reductase
MFITRLHARRVFPWFAAVAAITLVATGVRSATQTGKARVIPAPAEDEIAGDAKTEVAVLAGGCFWGVQGVYQHVKGVSRALSGYAGGPSSSANYETVVRGRSGHAESVQVTFDPSQVSYGKILQIFFSVAHDPTELNRQGPDVGTQYRSTIFPANARQEKAARAYIAQLNHARVFDAPVVTTIEMVRPFYAAEDYHQDYLIRNPSNPYIVFNDLPKIGELKRVFPDLYRSSPVLVNRSR